MEFNTSWNTARGRSRDSGKQRRMRWLADTRVSYRGRGDTRGFLVPLWSFTFTSLEAIGGFKQTGIRQQRCQRQGMALLVQDEEGMRCGEKAIMSGDSIE